MLRLSWVAFLIPFVLSSFSWGEGSGVEGQASRASPQEVIERLDPYIRQAMDDWQVPGAAVAVIHKGEVILSKGYGFCDLQAHKPVDSHTLFHIASLTKMITIALVGIYVNEGKLSWDDPIRKYLPELQFSDPQLAETLSIRDCLSHRVGLPRFAMDTLLYLGFQHDDLMRALPLIPPAGVMREDFAYQNVFVGLVGKALEKITGESLEALYQKHFFSPLEWQDSQVGLPYSSLFKGKGWVDRLISKLKLWFSKGSSENIALPHDILEGAPRRIEGVKTPENSQGFNPYLYTYVGSTGLNMSLYDLIHWAQMVLDEGKYKGQQVVPPAVLAEMRKPHVIIKVREDGRQFPPDRVSELHYGMGFFVHDYAGVPMVSHMGAIAGSRTLVVMIPEENTALIVLSNLGGLRVSYFPEAIRNKFLDIYLKASEDRDWSQELKTSLQSSSHKFIDKRRQQRMQSPLPSHPLEVYVGTYKNSLYGSITFEKEGDHLVLTYQNRRVPLRHWNGNEFIFDGWKLASAYSGNDIGFVKFIVQWGKSVSFISNLLFEGANPYFDRVSDQGKE